MTKTELISTVAEKTGVSKANTDAVVKEVLATITSELAKGESVALVGFGTFSVSKRAARTGVNPRTKEKISIPECNTVRFSVSKNVKQEINN